MAPLTETRIGRASLAVFVLTFGTLALAWGFQLVGGYVPCPLCLQQRWPYYAVIVLSAALLVVLSTSPTKTGLARAGLVLAALVMLAGAGLGVYHAGVEWHWWAGPAACGGGAGLSGGLPDLSTARVVRCDEAQWRFLGLSFAGWNVIVSCFVAAAALWGARRPA
ncbi:MAG: disulfide bond formation protein B [Parvibaculaceae bacterium]